MIQCHGLCHCSCHILVSWLILQFMLWHDIVVYAMDLLWFISWFNVMAHLMGFMSWFGIVVHVMVQCQITLKPPNSMGHETF